MTATDYYDEHDPASTCEEERTSPGSSQGTGPSPDPHPLLRSTRPPANLRIAPATTIPIASVLSPCVQLASNEISTVPNPAPPSVCTEAELVRKRATIKSKLTIFTNFVDGLDGEDPSTISLLRIRLAKIQKDASPFDSIQDALESVTSTVPFEQRLTERHQFDDLCTRSFAKAQDIIRSFDALNCRTTVDDNEASAPNTPPITPTIAPAETHIKIPPMHLPQFSGSYEGWPGFADAFRSAIHENPQFRDTQKLQYLRSCLTGKAAEKIESLETTSANYTVAWQILERNYNDPTIVINNRVRAFFDLPTCSKFDPTSFSDIVDQATKHYAALTALKRPFLEAFPIHAVVSKLDERTRLRWKERTQGNIAPTMEELLEFLHQRRRLLEPLAAESTPKSQPTNRANFRNTSHANSKPVIRAYAANTTLACHICKGNHYTYSCDNLKSAQGKQRVDLVKRANLCLNQGWALFDKFSCRLNLVGRKIYRIMPIPGLNCLRPQHTTGECTYGQCRKCNAKHHTMLHIDTEPTSSVQCNLVALPASNTRRLLSTARVNIKGRDGTLLPCRVLLDSGSEAHFLTERFAKRLDLPKSKTCVSIKGIHGYESTASRSITTEIQSTRGNFNATLTFLLLPKITEQLPANSFNPAQLEIPSHLDLADPDFHRAADIDGLIGGDTFYRLICSGQLTLAQGDVIAQKTQLGWVLSGRIPQSPSMTVELSCHLATENIQTQLSKFWEIEEVQSTPRFSSEEIECENHYRDHTLRNLQTGRFTVRLPFKDNLHELGESYSVATKRLYALERSLSRNNELRDQYHEFLREYHSLGHMSRLELPIKEGYFLPHHAVVKQSSLTTKVRVVFDASAKTSSGISLNSTLMGGPTIQDDLFTILVRFRSHVYAISADIAKMYRQIHVHSDDRKYQQILWREKPTDPIRAYTRNTVTYGTLAAPFLATRTLKELAAVEKDKFPLAAAILERDFYVDDLLTGAPTVHQAKEIRDQLIQLCNRGGFQLRQWASNDNRLIETLNARDSDAHLTLDPDETVKTLGLQWNARSDSFQYTVNTIDNSTTSKRSILSAIAKLFDPLGLLAPIIIRAKLILQQLWQYNLGWDEPIPERLHCDWNEYCKELPSISDIKFPRCTISKTHHSLELHGFCDASQLAYGACLYLRSIDSNNQVQTHLICSKSRVAPLKTVTLPRLELCAAQLLIKLFKSTKAALHNLDFQSVTFWSDSTIVLNWINTAPHTLKTFVAHRITAIQSLSRPEQWRHVPSEHNPADLVSRGVPVRNLLHQSLWHHGPSWLAESATRWPNLSFRSTAIPELKAVTSLPVKITDIELTERFSNFSRMLRVIAYCRRFVHNCRGNAKTQGPLTPSELTAATQSVIKGAQKGAYSAAIKALQATGQPTKDLRSLTPFLDSNGILRVGGRLTHSALPHESKHQALLPRQHHLTRLIIRDTHVKNLHAGAQATLNAVRQGYWIPNGMNTIKSVIHECVKCRRCRPVLLEPTMGNLPKDRVTMARPFLKTGLDFCGPLFIKERLHRNRGKLKVYVAIFVCFTTKAIHIELVQDLTTEALMAALKRFFSRRGMPTDLYSDNATNFVGANRELRALREFLDKPENQASLCTAAANEHVHWHFIPPRAPHSGGLWEAAVKSVKHHLVRTVGDTILSYEALLTYLSQIEAILNSRPITAMSSDPNDLNALTPAHFLLGAPITSVTDIDWTDTPNSRLSGWQQIQKMRQHFWRRWVQEYLHTQTTKRKWHTSHPTAIKKGMLVTIYEDTNVPLHWPLGRIIDVHPGGDGIIRVATVKTARGVYKRPIRKLSPLPITDDNTA